MAETVKLNYSEAGQGVPVVMLHGFPLASGIWQAQQQGLSDGYRVITPDLRGHGQSPTPEGVYEMELVARDVLALLDSLEIDKAVILGHSMGGYAVLAGWKLAPERFLALGLIASQAAADSDEARQGRYKTADKVAAEGSQVVADAMMTKLFGPTLAADSPIREQVRQMILKTSPIGIVGTLKGMAARVDSTAPLAKIQIPLLILAGESDQIIPLEKAKGLAAAIPQATLKVIGGAGHMPMLEQPAATTAAIREFLTKIKAFV